MTYQAEYDEDIIELKNSTLRDSAYCKFGQEVFFLLADGTQLRTLVTSSREESIRLFQAMTSGPRRKIVFPYQAYPWIGVGFAFRDMQTPDGQNFFVRNWCGDLYIVNWFGSDKPHTIAESVGYFQLFGDTIVIMTETGKLRLMRFRFTGQLAEYSIVDMKTELARDFIAVPEKQHLWILSRNDQIIRYRMPSLPSDGAISNE
jgi:hypothetical protein